MRIHSSLALLASLAACGGTHAELDDTDDTLLATPSVRTFDSAAYLLEGFQFGWEDHPHRMRWLGAKLYRNRFDGATLTGRSRTTLLGGTWSSGVEGADTADYRVWAAALKSSRIAFHHGVSAVTADGSDDPRTPAVAVQSVSVPRSVFSPRRCADVAVLMRGFLLDTSPTHDQGFTMTGIEARITTIVPRRDRVDFSFRLGVEGSDNPDRPTQGLEDYGITGRFYYTVACITAGAVTHGTKAYTMSYPYSWNGTQAPASPATQTASLTGEPGLPFGLIGLRGFKMQLNDGYVLPGRYLRDIRVRVRSSSYDDSTGRMSFRVDGWFSNRGPIQYALSNDFRAEYTLIQLDDPNAEVVRRSVGGSQRIGGHTYRNLTTSF